MFLNISGFLPDNFEDTSIKFDLNVDPECEQRVMDILGWQSLDDEADGVLPLSNEQVHLIAEAIGAPLPEDLDMFIGVYE